MNLLIVESPAKAGTINKYLGKDYKVLSSYGHIRDLPSKAGSVDPENNFALKYEVDKASEKRMKPIYDAVKSADKLILATDPDREGESISWHILEALKEKKKLPKDLKIERVAFNEITKSAILKALEKPRTIDLDLVNAQQARRALDYLVGFTISPILWRKLPGSRSAGRVQSVALRLICEREAEIEIFKPVEYWDIFADFLANNKDKITAKLYSVAAEKLEKLDIKDKKSADALLAKITGQDYQVAEINEKLVKRRPQPPYITSTLQQDAANRLGFGTKRTMQVAQKLYEGIDVGNGVSGLITYMRTDGVTLSQDAIASLRGFIGDNYGADYLPAKPHFYKSKVKNAQEAHEAIRPTDISRTPEALEKYLTDEQFKLYRLIWQRTVASQMAEQQALQTRVDIISADQDYLFRVTGTVIKFPGFTKVFTNSQKDDATILPKLEQGQKLDLTDLEAKQHFTEPPPRFNEASLVKKMEELGIGRPSTYATIISILVDREYARLEGKRFFPEPRGRIVTEFLVNFFEQYFEYDFTANLEAGLDDVASGKDQWQEFLTKFWQGFAKISEKIADFSPQDINKKIDESLEYLLFADEEGNVSRSCPSCNDGVLGLKMGKFGAFLACSNYPDCKYTKQIGDQDGAVETQAEEQLLGADADGNELTLKKGPYGPYIEVAKEKPQKISVPKFLANEAINLELARKIASLPRLVGTHPDDQKEVKANNGRYGPYLMHAGKFYSMPAEKLFTVELAEALEIIAKKASAKTGTVLGKDPESKEDIKLLKGRYGPYLKVGKSNVAIGKNYDAENLTLEQALEILAKKKKK